MMFKSYQMKPIEGAESGGALGFFKGVGQGFVGCVAVLLCVTVLLGSCQVLSSAVTKPAVGFFDLASNVSEGNYSLDFILFCIYQT